MGKMPSAAGGSLYKKNRIRLMLINNMMMILMMMMMMYGWMGQMLDLLFLSHSLPFPSTVSLAHLPNSFPASLLPFLCPLIMTLEQVI
jgi:hypothetical protein